MFVGKKWLPQWDTKWMLILTAVASLVVFVVLPMLYLVYKSFIINGTLDIHHYQTVYSKAVNWNALSNTIKVSLYSTVLAILISFPLAWLIGRTDLPWKGFFRTLFVATRRELFNGQFAAVTSTFAVIDFCFGENSFSQLKGNNF